MTLCIGADWLRNRNEAFSDRQDPAEDEASLSEIWIASGDAILTEAVDLRTNALRKGANLSACKLAEWLVWNWWRLRWEPRMHRNGCNQSASWQSAHELAGIGGGWLWPNIAVESDGMRVALRAKPTAATVTEPLRYVGGSVAVVPAQSWETGVDDFVERVVDRLASCSLHSADLAESWSELATERADPELSAYRKIEACLGFDVDEAPPEAVEQILTASAILGTAAMIEVSAGNPMTLEEIRSIAGSMGFESNAEGGVGALVKPEHPFLNAAWRVGVEAALEVRRCERLGEGPISDRQLAELCAVSESAFTAFHGEVPMAFTLQENNLPERVVFRSKWPTGRRFEAARLLADRVLIGDREALRPATAACTYRQKMQRAFAAEFLCPIQSLIDSLDGDFSDDAQERAADRFAVSPWAVAHLLANNRYLSRDDLDAELLAA